MIIPSKCCFTKTAVNKWVYISKTPPNQPDYKWFSKCTLDLSPEKPMLINSADMSHITLSFLLVFIPFQFSYLFSFFSLLSCEKHFSFFKYPFESGASKRVYLHIWLSFCIKTAQNDNLRLSIVFLKSFNIVRKL